MQHAYGAFYPQSNFELFLWGSDFPQFKEVLGKTQQGPVPFATEVGHSILYFPFAQNPDQLSWCDSADSVSVRQNKKAK